MSVNTPLQKQTTKQYLKNITLFNNISNFHSTWGGLPQFYRCEPSHMYCFKTAIRILQCHILFYLFRHISLQYQDNRRYIKHVSILENFLKKGCKRSILLVGKTETGLTSPPTTYENENLSAALDITNDFSRS